MSDHVPIRNDEAAFERHYRVSELAKLWGVGRETVRKIVCEERGVTGLRISDVATFDIDKRLDGNNVFLRMHKTRKPLFTWIPDWLVKRLEARKKEHGSLIFRCGVTLNMKQLCDIWRNKRLKKVFSLSGPWEEKPTPHRFRHTFVRILLEKGVPVPDVAELIGDAEETVRKHYSKWIKTRQDRLTRILREALDDKLKPKLASIRRLGSHPS